MRGFYDSWGNLRYSEEVYYKVCNLIKLDFFWRPYPSRRSNFFRLYKKDIYKQKITLIVIDTDCTSQWYCNGTEITVDEVLEIVSKDKLLFHLDLFV